MHPPPELNPHPLTDADGKTLNHPANLLVSYDLIARQHQITLENAEQVVAANYTRLFGA
jgi:TatD DNase family protein